MAFQTTPSPSGDTWDKLIKAKNKQQHKQDNSGKKKKTINKTTLARVVLFILLIVCFLLFIFLLLSVYLMYHQKGLELLEKPFFIVFYTCTKLKIKSKIHTNKQQHKQDNTSVVPSISVFVWSVIQWDFGFWFMVLQCCSQRKYFV